MSGDDRRRDEMRSVFTRRRHPLTLDEDTAARLLTGRLDPADAPPGFAEVARVIAAAAAPARRDELAGEDEALTTYRAVPRPTERPAPRAPGPAPGDARQRRAAGPRWCRRRGVDGHAARWRAVRRP